MCACCNTARWLQMLRNHIYKYDPYTPVENLINGMTKNEVRMLLDDYDHTVDNKKHNKHLSLSDYRRHCHRLNAALCIQHYVNARHAKYIYVNQVCPITLSPIANPIELIFKYIKEASDPTLSPFQYYVCVYELCDLSKYLMTSIGFVDLITQRPLSRLHIRKIDTMIHRQNLFLPSLFNMYMSRKMSDSRFYLNPHTEIQALLLGLERSIAPEISLLHDYLFEPPSADPPTSQTTHHVKNACAMVACTLNQIKKVDHQHMVCVKSNLYEHLKHATRGHANLHTHIHGLQCYIFDSLNRIT